MDGNTGGGGGTPVVALTEDQRLLWDLTFMTPRTEGFWHAVHFVQGISQGDTAGALGFVETLRNQRHDLDNDQLASLDHYFQNRLLVEKYGIPGMVVMFVNTFYVGWKWCGFPVPITDDDASPSPVSWFQAWAGNMGAYDGAYGTTGGGEPTYGLGGEPAQ